MDEETIELCCALAVAIQNAGTSSSQLSTPCIFCVAVNANKPYDYTIYNTIATLFLVLWSASLHLHITILCRYVMYMPYKLCIHTHAHTQDGIQKKNVMFFFIYFLLVLYVCWLGQFYTFKRIRTHTLYSFIVNISCIQRDCHISENKHTQGLCLISNFPASDHNSPQLYISHIWHDCRPLCCVALQCT